MNEIKKCKGCEKTYWPTKYYDYCVKCNWKRVSKSIKGDE